MADSGSIPNPNPAPVGRPWLVPAALCLVAVLTLAFFWPALHNGFIDYDDNDYVTLNMAVRQGLTLQGALWSFTAYHAANWHPLTWLSHMLDVQLFDLNPAGHHATSVLLHAANATLLCLFLHRATGLLGRSVVVALLFALHPLHVESVAWVAERKDVLSTFFWLLTMLAYLRYTRAPSAARYAPVLLLLGLGLMAKQMLVTLPLVLLLLDFWPLERLGGAGANSRSLKNLIGEKLPLCALSVAAALTTFLAQSSAGAVRQGARSSVLVNAGNALISYVKYLIATVFPVDLALFYPFDPAAVTFLRVAGAALVLAALSFLAVSQRGRRPYLAFGWFWYLVTLLPVIGFLRIGDQALADRYSYVPLIGIFVAVTWLCTQWAERFQPRGVRVAGGAAAALLALLGTLTVKQIGYWNNSAELFGHALAAVPGNWLAHNNLGILLFQQNRHAEALRHFRESVRLNPNAAEGYRNLGNAYQATGNGEQALAAFREAVRINPDDLEAHFRLGYTYLMGGNAELAYQEYLKLQSLDPARAQALRDSIRMSTGR